MRAPQWTVRWSSLLAVFGGLLWIGFGTTLALRPSRVPGISYRASLDLMPWFGVGLLLIAAAALGLYARQQERAGRLGAWALSGIIFGSVLYALGHILRQFLRGGWEPAVPVGFLTVILSFVLLGVATARARVFPRWVAGLVLFAAACLLVFNDQHLSAWTSLPFGLTWILLGTTILRSPTPSPA